MDEKFNQDYYKLKDEINSKRKRESIGDEVKLVQPNSDRTATNKSGITNKEKNNFSNNLLFAKATNRENNKDNKKLLSKDNSNINNCSNISNKSQNNSKVNNKHNKNANSSIYNNNEIFDSPTKRNLQKNNFQLNDINFVDRKNIRNKNQFPSRTNTISPNNLIYSWKQMHKKDYENTVSLKSISDSVEKVKNNEPIENKTTPKALSNANTQCKINAQKAMFGTYNPNRNNKNATFPSDVSKKGGKNNLHINLNNANYYEDPLKIFQTGLTSTRNFKTFSSTKINSNENNCNINITGLNQTNIFSKNYTLKTSRPTTAFEIEKNQQKGLSNLKKRNIQSARSTSIKRLMDISPYVNVPKSVKYSWLENAGIQEKYKPKLQGSLKDYEGNRFKHVSHGSFTIFLKEGRIKQDFLRQLLNNKPEFSLAFIKAIKIKNIRRLISLKPCKYFYIVTRSNSFNN